MNTIDTKIYCVAQEEIIRQRQEEKMKKLQEIEMKRQQAAILKEQVNSLLLALAIGVFAVKSCCSLQPASLYSTDSGKGSKGA
jgi:hypothetical protein